MVHSSRVFASLLLLVWVNLAATTAVGQSRNPFVINLFKEAVAETDVGKKIAAYKEVIAQDSLFVEAYFNLGITYKQQQDYRNAERFLSKAHRLVNPARAKDEFKARILYELAAAGKKLGKLEDCEGNLRAAKALAGDADLRSMISFELGRLLYEQLRYQEAFVEFKEGQKLSAKNKTFFTNFLQVVEKEIELLELYETARQAEASGNLKEAIIIFAKIQAQNPAYKDVEARIALLDSLLSPKTARKNALAEKFQQAGKHASEGSFELAISLYESLLQEAGDYKDARAQLEQARLQLEAKQRDAALENEYAAGIVALRAQNWTRAIVTFERVLQMDENYRDARQRLKEAENNLERESTETICVRYYADGVAAMNQKDLGGALAAFEKVKRLNPNYRDLAALLGAVERELQQQSSAAAASFNSLAAQNAGQLAQQEASGDLDGRTGGAMSGQSGNSAFYYVASVFAALIVLPLLGFMASPAGRARLHLLFGNYAATMRIYENMLIRHPERARLNPAVLNTLATYYLLERRVDERALDVYQQVQKLNLPISNREEINSILQQHYLTAGKNNTNAVEVLEQSLKSKSLRIESLK